MKQGLTTQNSEVLYSSVNSRTQTYNFPVSYGCSFITHHLSKTPDVSGNSIVSSYQLPTLTSVVTLDTVLAQVQIALDSGRAKVRTENMQFK